ncbi:MAG TPA: S8 family serine peptidase [Syntrophomonadaceae bacterium]|nr:S8 family serine peptidase [Syntrophomonadaceae bacterium]
MKRNIYLLSGVLLVCFFLQSSGIAMAFTDTRVHWARPQIDHLESREIINGYPDGTYRPDSYISRAEFITLLISFLNNQEEAKRLAKGDSTFKDVVDDYWAKGYINLAAELGIAAGDDRGHFKPYHLISREEAVVMLVNSLKIEDLEIEDLEMEDLPYEDQEEVSAWAIKELAYAAEKGFVNGYPDGSFKPKNKLTRAEVTILLEKLLELEGRKFHFQGTLIDINLPLKQVTVNLDNNEETFKLAGKLAVYQEGSIEPVTEIPMPSTAYFNLNQKGELNYIYLTEELVPSPVKLLFSSLPESSKMVAVDSSIVKLSDPEHYQVNPDLASSDPSLSLATTKAAMRVDEFVADTGATGRGQLVAVIDSGVDVGHPDLQKTSDGYEKVVDFIDLTDEGKVTLSGPIKAENGQLNIDGKKVDIIEVNNAAGEYYYGYLGTSFLPKVIKDALPDERFLVVLTASKYYDNFDTVYIDTNMDGKINDETPLIKYSRKRQMASIKGNNDKVFNLLVSEIAKDNKYVKFGFDSLGHGTEVAGIVAANGKLEGVAPGAQILPIKVLNNLGFAYLNRLESGILLAAEMGANIAVMSMGQYQISPQELQKLSNLADKMWETHGMLLCIAAGNNGPGLGTVADTAAIRNVISVGAYATPEMWRNDYGWEVEKPTLWYFSSSGPGTDGLTAPLLVAPGSVVSTFPLWGNSIYRLDEGTSMAAPHIAGAAALLMDVVAHKLYLTDSMIVAQGLTAGAKPLEGYEAVEQGFGAVDLVRAWQEIQKVKDQYVSFKVNQYSPNFGYGNGYYSREIVPAELSVKIFNKSDENRTLAVGGLSSWIKPQQFSIQVPKQGERTIRVKYDDLTEPGLYSDFLIADDHDTPGWDISVLQTVVVPYNLGIEKFEKADTLGAGEFKRYFVNVPEGVQNLKLDLEVGQNGRARMHVISPAGMQDVSSYVGTGQTLTPPNLQTTYYFPVTGTWEIVIYSSATLSSFDLKETKYNLKAQIGAVEKVEAKLPDKRYLVTAYPPKFMVAGEKTEVVLHFWNAISKEPANGIITINGRLYEIRNGLVRVETLAGDGAMDFKIAW